MKVLVTGGAGFIGSHLCEKLLDNYKVVCIDNFFLGSRENIKHLLSNKNFTFHQCEILNATEFENIFRIHHFDVIFHLAANSDISKGNPEYDFKNTLSTTLVVLEKCRKFEIKELIFASSGSIYGEAKDNVTESDCGLPISHYAAAKVSSEAFISSYSSMYGIKSFICRLPSVCGERATHGILVDFIKKLKANPKVLNVLGDGEQNKPYMYVKDCVDAMIYIWQNAKETINIYNIAGIGQTSVKDIAKMIVDAISPDAGIQFQDKSRGWNGDVTQYKCDISALEYLGWIPKRKSDDAVKLAIKKMI